MRKRMIAAIVGVVCAVIVAFSVPLLIEEGHRIRTAADKDLRQDADIVATRLHGLEDLTSVTDAELVVASAPELQSALYNTDGVRLVGRGPTNGGLPVRKAAGGEPDSGTINGLRIRTAPIVRDGTIVAVLRVADPLAEINAEILQRRLQLGTAAIGTIAAAALLATILSRRLLRPIGPMIETAQRLRDGDFTARSSPTGLAELDTLGFALNDAAERIGALVERERAFSADVAHQLRTPITSLKTAIETEQIDPREDGFLVLDELLNDVERLESTVAGLLALRRDAPKDRTLLSIAPIVDDLEAQYRLQLAQQSRRLVCQLDEGLPPVRASRSAVEQIVSILLANSVTHGAGRVTLHASTNAFDNDGERTVSITVSDEGPGIVGDTDAIFRRRVSGGTGHGIGLSLAGSLAYAEGATLTIDAPGPCPTFRLTLRAESAASHDPPDRTTLRIDRLGPASSFRSRQPNPSSVESAVLDAR